jgi:hypothetical protein
MTIQRRKIIARATAACAAGAFAGWTRAVAIFGDALLVSN